MKEIKSSRAFENLKPSDEQKERLFEKIMENNTQMETEEVSVRFVEDKRFSLKNIFYPAAAVIIMLSVIISAVPALRDMDKSMTVADKPADNQIYEENETDKTLKLPIDKSKRFRAELVESNAELNVSFAGVWNGKSYFMRNIANFSPLFFRLSSPDEKIMFNDEEGNQFSPFILAVNDDMIFAGNCSFEKIYVYDTEKFELLNVLDFGDMYSVCNICYSDGVLYSVDDNIYTSSNTFTLSARDLENNLINSKPLGDFGFYDVKAIGTVTSGDLVIIACSEKGTEAVFFDREFNVTEKEIICENEIVVENVSVHDDHITMNTLRYNKEKSREVYCWSVDENYTIQCVNHREIEYLTMYAADESSEFDMFYYDDELNFTGYRALDDSEEILTESDGSIFNVTKIGDEYFCSASGVSFNQELCTVPYGDEAISSVKTSVMSMAYTRNGHVYSVGYDQNKTESCTLYDTDISTGEVKNVELKNSMPLRYYKFTLKDDYYITSSYLSYDSEEFAQERFQAKFSTSYLSYDSETFTDYIVVYDLNGNLIHQVPLNENEVVIDIFCTSDNRLIVTSSDENYKSHAYEFNPETGVFSDTNESNLSYISSNYHQTGTDGYEVFYFTLNGIFGIKEGTKGAEWEKILDFDQVVFPTDERYSKRYNICGFWYDDMGDIYLAYADMTYKLKALN